MHSRTRFVLAAGFVAVAGAVSVLAAPALPERIVTNWNAAGEPSGTMSTPLALALVPLLGAVLVGLFALLPRVDPLRANVADFRVYYDWFVVVFAAYLLVVHAALVAFNLGYPVDVTQLILAAVGVLLFYAGVVLNHVEPNWFVGIRTPWTLSDDRVWDRTHRLGAPLFKLCGVLALVGLLFGEYAVYFVLVPVLATAAVTVVYSYVLYERLNRDGEVGPGGRRDGDDSSF
ncbi:SdpI family protein [Halobium salinum]|uniref:SdpI family protein n=1 Tax=Halobium salinum TaxID=1364940 RepID=A0ABD5P9J0_9EURY|nr:SdpI family protein [Halobium salinum]